MRNKDYSSLPGLDAPISHRIIILLYMMILVLEFVCYVALLVHLNRHNKAMAMILPAEQIKKRLHRNAIQLSGHTMKFLIKLVWMYSCAVAGALWDEPRPFMMAIQCFLWGIMYGVNGFIQVLMSPELMSNVKRMMNTFLPEQLQLELTTVVE